MSGSDNISETLKTVTGTYTVLPTDYDILVSGLTAAATVTLPNPTTVPPGRTFWIYRDASAFAVTLASAGTANIDGATTLALPLGTAQGRRVVTDGTNWFTMAGAAGSGVAGGAYNTETVRVVAAPTSPQTLLATDTDVMFTGLTAALTVNLPTVASVPVGKVVSVYRDASAFTATVTAQGTSVIDNGVATFAMAASQAQVHRFVTDGTNWYSLAAFGQTAPLYETARVVAAPTSPQTLLGTDIDVMFTGITAALTVNLPTVASVPVGKVVSVYRDASNFAVTVTAQGASVINNGVATLVLAAAQAQVHRFVTDGTNWFSLAAYGQVNPLYETTRTVSATTTATATDYDIIVAGATAAVTVTLPSGALVTPGKAFSVVKDAAAQVITVSPAAGTINGAASATLASGAFHGMIVVSDGTNYWIKSQY